MPDPGHIAALVAVSAAITWALRALPFAVLAPMRHSAVVRYLSLHMPLGVMAMLALYTVRDVPQAPGRQQLWLLIAVLVTAGLQLWWRHALLSIFIGTGIYVALMSL
ncbi:branched-chain amino acid transporter permease [Mycolicibacterium diernhoferi]|uniref:Branched-chain amino acid ABC transporter n=1 Tax=Mycolicibacterium diernhoferi TaxID=1801 RepID=A0A1Q4HCK2_9MYCO|nr:AzlD domain-containing protein [Mycolicibacterium diernhoferi]OJZ65279.1 branched-chain amino acid ABC transporter [Mycolicibacterium diernhoferi]OPE44998.1 branched-chain amino acid ABC transporter [Mycolicibacterium diernhoferi]PEG55185.1 branched-chain amino acid ABC transporter [Mycolicibacterium diernhoferi]QYL23603.1 AzlD domain-containing protein [Mycolicibacterium diernhoferi]